MFSSPPGGTQFEIRLNVLRVSRSALISIRYGVLFSYDVANYHVWLNVTRFLVLRVWQRR